jgi:hypothetical protein
MSGVVNDEGNEDSWLYGNEEAQAHFENSGHDNSMQSQPLSEPEKFDDSRLLDSTTEQDHLDNHPDFEVTVILCLIGEKL